MMNDFRGISAVACDSSHITTGHLLASLFEDYTELYLRPLQEASLCLKLLCSRYVGGMDTNMQP